MKIIKFLFIFILTAAVAGCGSEKPAVPTGEVNNTITVTDVLGREVAVPETVENIICSGPGCLRYLVYLDAAEMVVAVDDIEKRRRRFDARPYALAHPEFKKLPLFGEFRGHDNPELIVSLDPQPDVIFKTYSTLGLSPEELQKTTGIPVVVLNYGDLTRKRQNIYSSLKQIGKILEKSSRAEEVISFFVIFQTVGLSHFGYLFVFSRCKKYYSPKPYSSESGTVKPSLLQSYS